MPSPSRQLPPNPDQGRPPAPEQSTNSQRPVRRLDVQANFRSADCSPGLSVKPVPTAPQLQRQVVGGTHRAAARRPRRGAAQCPRLAGPRRPARATGATAGARARHQDDFLGRLQTVTQLPQRLRRGTTPPRRGSRPTAATPASSPPPGLTEGDDVNSR